MKKSVAETKERLTTPILRTPPIPADHFVSFGLTTLNLAVAGRTNGGIPKGTYVYFVGDSASGKSWFSLSVAAEVARSKHFRDYRIIQDVPERGTLMDLPGFFGAKLADRLEPPRGTRANPIHSGTVEEFYFNLDAALDTGPCLYILDSMDSLLTDEDEDRHGEARAAYEKAMENGTPTLERGGTYGTAKAKANSKNINRAVQRLAESGSILVVISQTRDKIGGIGFQTRTRAGGRALRFYSHVEIWSSVKGPIKVDKLGKEREIGSTLQLDVQKNRITGWEGKILVPFYRKLGLDDTGACVDFLLGEGHWGKPADKKPGGKKPVEKADGPAKGRIAAPEFDFEGTREALIAKIEETDSERELQLLVGDVWRKIEEACAPVRKPRYS